MRDNPWENFTIIVEDYFFVSNQMLKIICRGNYLLFLLKLYEKKSHYSKMKFRSIREILYRWSIIYDNSEAIISQNMSKCDKASTTKYIGKKVMCANHTPKRGVDIAPHTANCDRSTKTSRLLCRPARGARSSVFCHIWPRPRPPPSWLISW